MKLTIFGATGRTGSLLVEKALAAGHEVTALVRSPARITVRHGRLHIIQGDISNAAQVEAAVAGADAVISAVSTTGKYTRTNSTNHILAAMKKHGVKRLINATGAGVPDPNDKPQWIHNLIEWAVKTFSPDAYYDGVNHVAVIRQSDADWIVARAPMLTDVPGRGQYRVGYVGRGMNRTLSRADFAEFMLKQVSDNSYSRQSVVVSDM